MDESEIALKTAQLALESARVELWDDFLKIGIPSLVAIAGVISTYCISKSSHNKDLTIEVLRNSYNVGRENRNRSSILIENISIGITDIHRTALFYANQLYAKLDMEKDGTAFPQASRNELSKYYDDLVNSLHEIFDVEAKIFLLGEKEIEQNYLLYQSRLSELSMELTPMASKDKLDDLEGRLIAIRDSREKLFSSMSKAYLGRYAADNE